MNLRQPRSAPGMFLTFVCCSMIGCAGSASRTSTVRAPEAKISPKPEVVAAPADDTRTVGKPDEAAWFDCGNLRCRSSARATTLLDLVLERAKPLVVGFGEAHAPASATVPPTVRRFQSELLPHLSRESSALVVELLAPPRDCEAATAKTDETAREVTTGQAETNQNDYLTLGTESRRLGVIPDILRASCDDLRAIADAGELSVVVMMETIARLSATTVEAYRMRAKPEKPRVLAYGGMLHNDWAPRDERRAWSYGPELERTTAARYVEVDLIVPELIGDASLWSKFDFAEALDAVTQTRLETYVLIERSAKSYALVWPGTRPR